MHVLIYRSQQRSYRDLPIRLFELGTVYRYERAGTLHGLMRIRGFTQDDAHLFVAREGLQDELDRTLRFVLDMLGAFGFSDFQAKLSTKPEGKSVGSDDIWEYATECLRNTLDAAELPYEVDEGGGAFYGPKIDIDVRDAIGRSWQLSTLQADFQLPERFELEYVAADGSRQQPVMLHRALLGSIERFFGVLVEHYAGNFPLWLAPVQIEVLPVAEEHEAYGREVFDRLSAAGFRCGYTEPSDPLGKRIRRAKTQKVPYVLVVGSDDAAAKTVGVNPRGGEVERDVDLDEFLARLEAEMGERAASPTLSPTS